MSAAVFIFCDDAEGLNLIKLSPHTVSQSIAGNKAVKPFFIPQRILQVDNTKQ